jgi:hypothetical protein
MILAVHQPQYIPWLGYFDKIRKSDAFVFLDKVQYKGREFQNRNKIRTKDGWIWLSVPVVAKGLGRQEIYDVKVDNSFGWQKEHLASLRAWYGRSEFFEKHFPFFEELYGKEWESLSDLSVSIIMYMLKELSISTPLYFESKLDIKSKKTDRIIEICGKLKADTYLSGIGGKEYLEEGRFAEAGLKLAYQEFKHPVYRQQFMKDKDDFIPYMSTLDLLFNEGPRSKELLKSLPAGRQA